MTTLQAKQINAYMMLNSAFWHVIRNLAAVDVIIAARGELAAEMDSQSLLTAITLSQELEELERAA